MGASGRNYIDARTHSLIYICFFVLYIYILIRIIYQVLQIDFLESTGVMEQSDCLMAACSSETLDDELLDLLTCHRTDAHNI